MAWTPTGRSDRSGHEAPPSAPPPAASTPRDPGPTETVMDKLSDGSKSVADDGMEAGVIRFAGSRRSTCWLRCNGVKPMSALDRLRELPGWAPPSALISLDGPDALQLHRLGQSTGELISSTLEAGLVAVAASTNAWILTPGTEAGVGQFVTSGLEQFTVIGIMDAASKLTLGDKLRPAHSHFILYDLTDGDEKKPSDDLLALRDGESSHAQTEQADWGQSMLDTMDFRESFEEIIQQHDLSDDGCKTPCVAVLVNGDLPALERITRQIERGHPVVVIRDTLGAADLLDQVMHRLTRETAPASVRGKAGAATGSVREYVQNLLSTIPGAFAPLDEKHTDEVTALVEACVEKLRKSISSEAPLLVSFSTSEGRPFDEVVEEAMLADAEQFSEKIQLAVLWSNTDLLERLLSQPQRDHIVEREGLRVALLRRDTEVVETLIKFQVSPKEIEFSNLFTHTSNIYHLQGDTAHCWRGSKQYNEDENERQSAGESKQQRFESFSIESASKPDAPKFHGFAILAEWVDNYEDYLNGRTQIDQPEGKFGHVGELKTTWLDLFFWACLTGSNELARVLWTNLSEPLRAALMASQVFRSLSIRTNNAPLRRLKDTLLEYAENWEQQAIDLIDKMSEGDPNIAPLLTLMPHYPWQAEPADSPLAEASQRRSLTRRSTSSRNSSSTPLEAWLPLWGGSCLDCAVESDGRTAVPCRRFVAHRHSQAVLEAYFEGDFPGSHARLSGSVSLMQIMLQLCLPFFPGLFGLVPGCRLEVTSYQILEGDEKLDSQRQHEDYTFAMSMIDENRDAARLALGASKMSGRDAEEERVRQDSQHHTPKWWHLYEVPKVKLVVELISYVGYVLMLGFVAFFDLPQLNEELNASLLLRGTSNASHAIRLSEDPLLSGPAIPYVTVAEAVLWAWTLLNICREVSEAAAFGGDAAFDNMGAVEKMYETVRQYIRSPWNVLDVVIASLVTAAGVTRVITADDSAVDGLATARIFYGFTIAFVLLRSLQYLTYNEGVGVLIVILRSIIIIDVSVFAVLVLVFTMALGTALLVLLPEYDVASNTAAANPVLASLWGPLGALEHNFLISSSASDGQASAVFVITYLYVVIVIIWISLFTASMTETYQRVRDESIEFWQFERAQLILEFKEKPALASPLNLLSYLSHTIKAFLAFIGLSIGSKERLGNLEKGYELSPKGFQPTEPGFNSVYGPAQQRRLQFVESDLHMAMLHDRESQEKLQTVSRARNPTVRELTSVTKKEAKHLLMKLQRDIKTEMANLKGFMLVQQRQQSATKANAGHQQGWGGASELSA